MHLFNKVLEILAIGEDGNAVLWLRGIFCDVWLLKSEELIFTRVILIP